MNAESIRAFASECGKAQIFVDTSMAIGVFHDFLMQMKGLMVDRMVEAHKEQLEQAKAAQELPPHESEISAMPDQPCNQENSQECSQSCEKSNCA